MFTCVEISWRWRTLCEMYYTLFLFRFLYYRDHRTMSSERKKLLNMEWVLSLAEVFFFCFVFVSEHLSSPCSRQEDEEVNEKMALILRSQSQQQMFNWVKNIVPVSHFICYPAYWKAKMISLKIRVLGIPCNCTRSVITRESMLMNFEQCAGFIVIYQETVQRITQVLGHDH